MALKPNRNWNNMETNSCHSKDVPEISKDNRLKVKVHTKVSLKTKRKILKTKQNKKKRFLRNQFGQNRKRKCNVKIRELSTIIRENNRVTIQWSKTSHVLAFLFTQVLPTEWGMRGHIFKMHCTREGQGQRVDEQKTTRTCSWNSDEANFQMGKGTESRRMEKKKKKR